MPLFNAACEAVLRKRHLARFMAANAAKTGILDSFRVHNGDNLTRNLASLLARLLAGFRRNFAAALSRFLSAQRLKSPDDIAAIFEGYRPDFRVAGLDFVCFARAISARLALAQPFLFTWRPRAIASASGGTLSVTTDPAAT